MHLRVKTLMGRAAMVNLDNLLVVISNGGHHLYGYPMITDHPNVDDAITLAIGEPEYIEECFDSIHRARLHDFPTFDLAEVRLAMNARNGVSANG